MENSKFTPVDPDFYDLIPDQLQRDMIVVHYFDRRGEVDTVKGTSACLKKTAQGDFLEFGQKSQVRIDRIITINGKPGPAYEEYDNYALQCTTCMGGMD